MANVGGSITSPLSSMAMASVIPGSNSTPQRSYSCEYRKGSRCSAVSVTKARTPVAAARIAKGASPRHRKRPIAHATTTLPRPSPARNAASIRLNAYTDGPTTSARILVHATSSASAANPVSANAATTTLPDGVPPPSETGDSSEVRCPFVRPAARSAPSRLHSHARPSAHAPIATLTAAVVRSVAPSPMLGSNQNPASSVPR